MTQDDENIEVRYIPNASEADDMSVGQVQQNYANYRMIFNRSWDYYLRWAAFDIGLWAAIVGATVYAFALVATPARSLVESPWFLVPIPLVIVVVWAVLWFSGRSPRRAHRQAYDEWNQKFDRRYGGEKHVTISSAGVSLVDRLERIDQSWARFHLTVVQPENLVLVFHGTVVAIPNAALPAPPQEIGQRMARWAKQWWAANPWEAPKSE